MTQDLALVEKVAVIDETVETTEGSKGNANALRAIDRKVMAATPIPISARNDMEKANQEDPIKVNKTEEEWRELLTDEEFRVMRKAGTELPYSGLFNLHFENGFYLCKGCKTPLFSSASKFNSHCGWPSFDRALSSKVITERADYSHRMIRTEILCSGCGAHLGHVFPDGPTSTGVRYCVNSVCLNFKEEP